MRSLLIRRSWTQSGPCRQSASRDTHRARWKGSGGARRWRSRTCRDRYPDELGDDPRGGDPPNAPARGEPQIPVRARSNTGRTRELNRRSRRRTAGLRDQARRRPENGQFERPNQRARRLETCHPNVHDLFSISAFSPGHELKRAPAGAHPVGAVDESDEFSGGRRQDRGEITVLIPTSLRMCHGENCSRGGRCSPSPTAGGSRTAR